MCIRDRRGGRAGEDGPAKLAGPVSGPAEPVILRREDSDSVSVQEGRKRPGGGWLKGPPEGALGDLLLARGAF
eukprot:11736281-Prorocentrum_lima.AAC.1